ncbi:hypothetical protein D3C72_2189500 [compost metagenome]
MSQSHQMAYSMTLATPASKPISSRPDGERPGASSTDMPTWLGRNGSLSPNRITGARRRANAISALVTGRLGDDMEGFLGRCIGRSFL